MFKWHCSAAVLWFCIFSDDKSDVIFIFVPLYIMCPFFLSLSFKSFLFITNFSLIVLLSPGIKMSLKKAFTFYIFADFFNVWFNWEATYAEVLLQ